MTEADTHETDSGEQKKSLDKVDKLENPRVVLKGIKTRTSNNDRVNILGVGIDLLMNNIPGSDCQAADLRGRNIPVIRLCTSKEESLEDLPEITISGTDRRDRLVTDEDGDSECGLHFDKF